AHVAYALPPLSREERASKAKMEISTHFNSKQQVFLDFVLSHYVSVGVEELEQSKLSPLLKLRYHDSINDAVAAKVDLFKASDLQLIWQTGKGFSTTAKQLVADKKGIWANDFITKMETAYAAADVVVSRAGAMAIAELCVVKKPAVFVPFPFAAEDHQTANAMKLVNKNAGLLVADKDARAKLVETAIDLAKDKSRQQELIANISKLAVTNADEVIAKEVLRASKVLLNDGE
ncbi:MAG: hypothetical protein EOP49_24065, partial [Sphingobacteriales bacterium]